MRSPGQRRRKGSFCGGNTVERAESGEFAAPRRKWRQSKLQGSSWHWSTAKLHVMGRFRGFLTATTALTTALFVSTQPASGDCTTSSNGLVRTCTGDIDTAQSFSHLNAGSVQTYTFALKQLTSSSATSTADDVFAFLSSGLSRTTSTSSPGVGGSKNVFQLNTDAAVSRFDVHAFTYSAVAISSSGGSGSSRSENGGGGTRRGAAAATAAMAAALTRPS